MTPFAKPSPNAARIVAALERMGRPLAYAELLGLFAPDPASQQSAANTIEGMVRAGHLKTRSFPTHRGHLVPLMSLNRSRGKP